MNMSDNKHKILSARESRLDQRHIKFNTHLIACPENLPILAQGRVAVPGDEPAPRIVTERVEHMTCVGEHRPLLGHLAASECELKVLANLLEQLSPNALEASG